MEQGRMPHQPILPLDPFQKWGLDFQIQHRPRVQRTVADYLNHLESREPAKTTYDDLPDASLFNLTTMPDENEDEWITKMTHFLSTDLPPEHIALDTRKRLEVRSRNFCLVSDIRYHKGSDGIWRRSIRHFEKNAILQEAHQGVASGHYTGESTARTVWQSGLW